MYLSGLGIYYLKNGQPVDTLYVGDVMTFNVPGYSKIWLDQYQNGQLQYSGPFDLPMPAYTLQSRDVGSFTASVFELSPSGKKGNNIGTDRVTVLAAPASAQVQTQTLYAPPSVVGQGAPVYSNVSAGGSGAGTQLVSTGVPTPSAPPPNIVVQPPSGPIDLSTPYTPGGEQAPAPETQQAGFSGLGIALILGVAAFAFFGGKGKK